LLNINYEFQGFVNNQYIVKGSITHNKNRYSVLVEGPSLDEAKAKASDELNELVNNIPVPQKHINARVKKKRTVNKDAEV
jgi:hypothetical protein